MNKKVYVSGVGHCYEITINRINEFGINEPYCIYQELEDEKK